MADCPCSTSLDSPAAVAASPPATDVTPAPASAPAVPGCRTVSSADSPPGREPAARSDGEDRSTRLAAPSTARTPFADLGADADAWIVSVAAPLAAVATATPCEPTIAAIPSALNCCHPATFVR